MLALDAPPVHAVVGERDADAHRGADALARLRLIGVAAEKVHPVQPSVVLDDLGEARAAEGTRWAERPERSGQVGRSGRTGRAGGGDGGGMGCSAARLARQHVHVADAHVHRVEAPPGLIVRREASRWSGSCKCISPPGGISDCVREVASIDGESRCVSRFRRHSALGAYSRSSNDVAGW